MESGSGGFAAFNTPYEARKKSGRLASPAFKNCIRFTIGLDDEMHKAADAVREYMTGQSPG